MENPSQDSVPTCKTRSGRVSKPPVRYEPVEQVEDDYADDDYDSRESSISSEVSYGDSEDEDDSEDADDDGNLDGFVVADKSESDSDSTEDNGKPPVPNKKRVPVQKRKGPVRK
jgi:hypothetical protein